MSIAIRRPGEEYLPNGLFDKLQFKYPQEKGFYKDWKIVVHFYDTDEHDLHKRIEQRTDCVSFTDFAFLFKKSFYFLVRSLKETPRFNQTFVVSYRTRKFSYIVTFMDEVEGIQRVLFKTIRENHWKVKPEDKVFSIAM